MNDNSARLKGYLARDPEIRFTKTGKAVAFFTVACNRKYIINNQEKEATDFINCVLWGKKAERMGDGSIHKGTRVLVEGYISSRSYEKNGQKKYVTEIIVDFFAPERKDTVVPPKPAAPGQAFSDMGSETTDDIPF